MSRIWVTADTHYGHKNIVYGESEWTDKERCRNFETVKEHNDAIITNINTYIAEHDFLYHLGDWSMGGKENIYEFRKRINCKNIVLILGNHDHHIRKNAIIKTETGYVNAKNLFTSVHEILEKEWINKTFKCVLFHYPIHSWHKKNESINLYGHTHTELHYDPQAICVSLDAHPEFRPFSIEEIIEITKQRGVYENLSTRKERY